METAIDVVVLIVRDPRAPAAFQATASLRRGSASSQESGIAGRLIHQLGMQSTQLRHSKPGAPWDQADSEWWWDFFDDDYVTAWAAAGMFDATAEEVAALTEPPRSATGVEDPRCGLPLRNCNR